MGQEVELSYSIWIQASADEVWGTLTEPALSSQYFPYALIEGVWSKGSAYAMRRGDGSVVYDGKVIAADRPHRLVQTCNMKAIPTFIGHEEFVLEWVIEQSGDASKLTILHRGGEAAAQLIKMLVSHCPDTASGIKTLLETGKPLRMPAPVESPV